MAALRNLLAKIRPPAAAALRASRASTSSSLPKGDLEKALLLKIESAKAADFRSCGDLLDKHADQVVEAIRQVVDKQQEAVVGKFQTLAYKYVGSAVVFGCIHRMLEHYWKDKPDPEREFFAALEFPE